MQSYLFIFFLLAILLFFLKKSDRNTCCIKDYVYLCTRKQKLFNFKINNYVFRLC